MYCENNKKIYSDAHWYQNTPRHALEKRYKTKVMLCGPNSVVMLVELILVVCGISRSAHSPTLFVHTSEIAAASDRTLAVWLVAVSGYRSDRYKTSGTSITVSLCARVRMMREILWFVVVCSVWRISEPANGTVGECRRPKQSPICKDSVMLEFGWQNEPPENFVHFSNVLVH